MRLPSLDSPQVALFALVFGCYAYFYQAGGWNQNSRFDLTRAIVERGTLTIDAYHENTGDKAERDGHYYCDKAPGLSLLAVPAYAVAYRLAPGAVAEGAYVATLVALALPDGAFLAGRRGVSAFSASDHPCRGPCRDPAPCYRVCPDREGRPLWSRRALCCLTRQSRSR